MVKNKIDKNYYCNNKDRIKERYIKTSAKKNIWLWSHVKCECLLCLENDPVCLQFHHKNPKTKYKEVSYLIKSNNTNMQKVVDEILKCILVCSNCHCKIHAGKINVDDYPLIYVDREKMINSWDGSCTITNSRLGNNQYSKKFGN